MMSDRQYDGSNTSFADPRRGAALVAALGVALTLAGLSILILRTASDARFQTRRATENLLAEAALETVLAETLLEIERQTQGDSNIYYGEPLIVPSERGPVEVVVTSPSGRLDINGVSPLLLATTVRAMGAEEEDASALGDTIADWRDGDDFRHLNGAERDDYARAGLDGPANSPFRSVSELRGVIGMNETLFNCLATQVTIATGSTSPDLRHASPWLKAALGLHEGETDLLQVRLTPGEVYQINLRELEGGRFQYRLEVLIRPSGDPSHPLFIHDWVFESDSTDTEIHACPPPIAPGFEVSPS